MKNIIRLSLLLLLFTTSSITLDAQRYSYRKSHNYEVINLGTAPEGTKAIKIYVIEKNANKAVALAKMAAVETCIFRGIPATGSTSGTPALCDSKTESENAAFFEEFFEPGGRYLNYVNITSDGFAQKEDKIKVKGGYKVGVVVQILYENLKNDLKREGIIKSLGYGF